MPSTQPVVVIDHSTGKVTIIGETEVSEKGELASALIEQAQTMETAAVGTPPHSDEEA